MLGIRKYLGASIDLWQGEASQFVCDLLITLDDSPDLLASVVASLEEAEHTGSRHVTIAIGLAQFGSFPPKIAAEKCFKSARKFLDERQKRNKNDGTDQKFVRRMTFALTDGQTYESFQQALFREFPEELL